MNTKILDALNPEQIQAVIATEGHIRVIAGAGSGKTKALTNRFAYLVETLGISPSNILCVTFTNKAAAEMKRRIRGMIGDVDLGMITTFHGFAVQLLREDCHIVQYPSRFIVLDEEDVESIIRDCFERLHITTRQMTVQYIRDHIAFLKSTYNRDEYIKLLSDPQLEQLKRYRDTETDIKKKVFYEYLMAQRKSFGFDFDDLIIFALHILSVDEQSRNKWQQRIEYMMIDEFQDVDGEEYALANILSGYHKNLFVVGDPDQTIYSWRGADVNFILDFDKRYTGCKTIIMNRNYRSLSSIITASNALIKKNKNRIDKSLIPVRAGSGQAVYYHAKTQAEEAEWITNRIKALHNEGAELSNIAILYRAHHVSRNIEEAFVRNKIPYVLYSGIEFYRRKEIKDVLAYLRLICTGDDLSFLRTVNEPKRGIGRKRIEYLKQYSESNECSLLDALKHNIGNSLFTGTQALDFIDFVKKYSLEYTHMALTDLITAVLNDSGYESFLRKAGDEERLDNLAELKQSIFEFELTAGEATTLIDYLEHVALFTNLDKNERPDTVKLMTVHTAKGLEFPYVFICALNEGIFPSKKTNTREKLEEERRLAYVAFTRARDKLFLTESAGYNFDGAFRYPSRFIFNAEKENLEYASQLPPELCDEAIKYIMNAETKLEPRTSLFNTDDLVLHPVFGKGRIKEVDAINSCYKIEFETLQTLRSIYFNADLKRA